MQATMKDVTRLMTRRSRSGQSIIIIALGFIVLIGFVGIATDTALLFVRFSTLRRAVDSAAVAAAGQVRENTTFAQVAAAAEMFIKNHGLDPTQVRVETCETEIDDYKKLNGPEPNPGDYRNYLSSSTSGRPNSELCKKDPAKLVRVSAMINSPTTFLSILGFRNITLSASSISQTAVMDVVMLMDGSLSMAYDTKNAEVANDFTASDNFAGFTTVPDTLGNHLNLAHYDATGDTLGQPYKAANYTSTGGVTGYNPYGSIRAECRKADEGYKAGQLPNYGFGGCCNDPITQSDLPAGQDPLNYYIDSRTGEIHAHGPASDPPRPGEANLVDGRGEARAGKAQNYSDLICHPFKEVRDAVRRFLLKVDFVRGDRVMLVEFDAKANGITSTGIYGQAGSTTLPVFTSKTDAIVSLNRFVGMEAQPSGLQTNPISLSAQYPYSVNEYFYETVAPSIDTNTGAAIRMATSLLTDPRWIRRDSVWISVLLSDGYPNRTPGVGIIGDPVYYNPGYHLTPNNQAIAPTTDFANPSRIGPTQLYPNGRFFEGLKDIYGSTYNSTSLSGQNDPIFDPGFCPWWTFCDTKAGHQPERPGARPYSDSMTEGDPSQIPPWPARLDYTSTQWNAMWCTENDNSPIWWDEVKPAGDETWHEGNANPRSRRPFCSDNNPDTRHYCMDPNTGTISPANRPDLCSTHYDPDDYARDQVDFAALIDYTPTIKGNFIAMFSIFFPHSTEPTLAENILGVKFMRYVADAGDNGVIDNRLQKWYRNQTFGSGTYQKDPIPPDASFTNDSTGFSSAGTGLPVSPDPCAQFDFRDVGVLPAGVGSAYEDLVKHNCGNYYYAGNAGAIDRAFTDIASRLFTRLAR